jgi:TDG/mug DNA glycosylase family protein
MSLPDVAETGLRVLFCGINPGVLAAATGHHFAGRGNRFWRVMHLAGFTPHQIAPPDSGTLLRHGCGLTTVVERATASEDQIDRREYQAAAAGFERKIAHYAPAFLAFLGKPALAGLTGRRDIAWGRQSAMMGASGIWVLPNPSGRNRAFSLDRLVDAYRDLNEAAFGGPLALGAVSAGFPTNCAQGPEKLGMAPRSR